MSRILRRPMFRGGQVESKDDLKVIDQMGIANLATGGRVGYDSGGEVIVVSQFTLYASTKKGNRPSYIKAAKPSIAVPLYNKFIDTFESKLGKKVQTGKFGSHMELEIYNDGPVTIIIDTKNKF